MPKFKDATLRRRWVSQRCFSEGFSVCFTDDIRNDQTVTWFAWAPTNVFNGATERRGSPSGIAWLSGGHRATTGPHWLAVHDFPALHFGGCPVALGNPRLAPRDRTAADCGGG